MDATTNAAPGVRTRRVCPVRQAPQLFYLCAAMYIIGVFGRMSFSAVTVELITGEGFTKAQAGLIGTALFAVYGACQFFAGFLGDRVPPKKMVFTGVFGSALLNLGMGLSSSYRPMLVLWALNGAFQACIWSPVFKVFSEVLPPRLRLQACENAAATNPIATVLTYLFAAAALHTLGWRAVFLLSGGLMAAASLYWLRRMGQYERLIAAEGPVERIPIPQGGPAQAAGGALLPALIASGVLFAVAASAAHGMLRDGIQAWVPTFLSENFRFGSALSTAMAIVLPVFNVVGVFAAKAIHHRWIRNEMRGTAGFFAAAAAALALLAPLCRVSAAGSLALMTLVSACMIGANILLINIIPIRFGALGRASSVTGVLNCAAYAGSALSSYGIGAVADAFGWPAAVCAWLGFALLALAGALLGARRWEKYRSQV